MRNGVLECGGGPYQNAWFVAEKKNKRYRLVNAATEMNRHMIQDANLPLSPDEFCEGFAGCQMTSLIDFFSGYDHVELNIRSRNMTAFQTPN